MFLGTSEPREVGLRATFRKSLPDFVPYGLTDSLGLTDPALIDACNHGTGILRVTSYSNTLYTQYVASIHAPWPTWTNSGIALYTGSRPAVDSSYVWYQKSNGQICYRNFSNWAVEVVVGSLPGATALAPISTTCFALWQRTPGSNSYEIRSMSGTESCQYMLYNLPGMPRLDAVSFSNKTYLYTTDQATGRIVEIQHSGGGANGKDSYGVLKPVIPIDAIDSEHSFKPGYASVIDNKVVVTGCLVRTSDDATVVMDVYAAGPEFFSMGKEMFIKDGTSARPKMLRVGNEFVCAGTQTVWIAKATNVFGGDMHPDLELITSDFTNISLTEAEARSTNLNIEMAPDVSHTAMAPGSDVELEMAYNDNWCRLTTCSVEADRPMQDDQGASRMVSGIGKSAKRLASWSPDQGVWVPSQARMYDNPASMTQVVRATGKWESMDPEDPAAPLKLNDLNKLGVLYSSARSSRGGAMRGKFYYPSDTYFKPYYGVAINYYRESAAEAAERLGVEINDLEDDMFGHNGIVAIFSLTEHNDTPGIGLYRWKDSSLTKLTSSGTSLPSNAWHWMQIEFIEGEIRVKVRLDANTTWIESIVYSYASSTSPWKRETFGRGAVVMKNLVPTTQMIGGISSSDDVVGVWYGAHSNFPASGQIKLDNEVMSYSSKVDIVPAIADLMLPAPFWPQERLLEVIATGGALSTGTLGVADNSITGAAIVMLEGYHGYGRTLRCTGYDNVCNQEGWVPNSGFIPGWSTTIGNLNDGQWVPGTTSVLYMTPDPRSIMYHGGEMQEGPLSLYHIRSSFVISQRGTIGVTTSHDHAIINYYTTKSVQCAVAASFSQDEDQSMEDALKTIVRLSGGEVVCRAAVNVTPTFTGSNTLQVLNDHKNFIATMELPTINDNSSVGVAFRATSPMSWDGSRAHSAGGNYQLEVERAGSAYHLALYNCTTSAKTLLERIPLRPTNLNGSATAYVPSGTLKVSVQDNFISAWLNGRYLHTFQSTLYADGLYIAFVSRQVATISIRMSELDDLLSDIVVGTRGNGMSVLSELIADRHILWRDEPDGSLYFYRTRAFVGHVPDVISAVAEIKTDAVISRMRAEGVGVSEVLDAGLMRTYGNTFATINARHANDVGEARKEALLLLDESWRNAFQKRYIMDVDPSLQPGDDATFADLPNGERSEMIVRGQSITIGFTGSNFVCDMQCDVAPAERS
jgi:hypothetical protein